MIEVEWWDYESLRRAGRGGCRRHRVHHRQRGRGALGHAWSPCPAARTRRRLLAGLAKQDVPWKKVTIIPTDDRLVAVDDERSKIRAIAKSFLPLGRAGLPGGQRRRPTITSWPAMPPMRGSRTCRGRPTWCGSAWATTATPLDLSQGPDLHAALDAPKARRAIGVMPEGGDGMARISLTRAAILAARTLLITVIGQDKRELLEGAIADGHSSKLPIGRVLAEVEQPIDIHWCP